MREVTMIGLDLAKNVFQVHGVDALGEATIRLRLGRRQVTPLYSTSSSASAVRKLRGSVKRMPWKPSATTSEKPARPSDVSPSYESKY